MARERAVRGPGGAFSLAGRRIVITGAAGGIGAAAGRACAELGASLVLCDRELPEAIAAKLNGAEVDVAAFDVADRAAVERALGAYPDIYGVVAAAGIYAPEDWHAEGWDDDFDRVIDVNVRGSLNVARTCLDRMIVREEGRIVLVGSQAGFMGGFLPTPAYVASKGAVHSLVRWLARNSTPHNVLVNGVVPGPTDTTMIRGRGVVDAASLPLGRVAAPEEIAGAIAFLMTPAASYIAGELLNVNGGAVFN